MTGFCSTSVYAATLEQFRLEGGEPLEFIWHHDDTTSRLTFHPYEFHGQLYGRSKYSFVSSLLLLGGATVDGDTVRRPSKGYYNEFPLPLRLGVPTPTTFGLGRGGRQQRSIRKLEICKEMEQRIKDLNHAATKRLAAAQCQVHIGHGCCPALLQADRPSRPGTA